MSKNRLNFTFGLPNLLTFFRILLTPIFIFLLLNEKFVFALFVFIIAGISDMLDGFVARYLNQNTRLGAFLDPLADKILLMSAFICLFLLKAIPHWLSIVTIFREFLIIFGLSILFRLKKPYRINPIFLSKCNTFLQIIVVIESLVILINPEFNDLHFFLCLFTGILTFLSGLKYIYIWFILM